MELAIGKTGDRDLVVDAQELVTGRTCIIAQSGAGKSWSIAVLCEQLCKARIGFCLIDTEGEYFSLKDRFELCWVGSGDDCDVDIERVDLAELMRNAIKSGTPVIYDVSETQMQEKVTELTTVLYDLESELRKPYLLIVEEADKFIPQSGESIKKIEEISRRGRKRGLGILVATQRPSLVVKNVLSQCNSQIIGKLSIENDLKAVGVFFGSRKEVEELSALEPGEFFVMGSLAREKVKMRFGRRETEHRGLTPKLAPGKPARQSTPRTPRAHPPPQPPQPPAPRPTPADEGVDEAIVPVLIREEAIDIAKSRRRRKFPFLDPEERIVAADAVYWPLAQVEVKYIGGLLRKTTKTASFVLDLVAGRLVDVNRGMKMKPGFSELFGLDETAVKIIARLPPGGSTLPEIEADTREAPETVKRAVKDLEKRKLVTEVKTAGKATVFMPLLLHEIPRLQSLRQSLQVKTEPLRGSPRPQKIRESDLRSLLKAIEPTLEIAGWRTVYYPVYEVVLAAEDGERRLYLDGISGRDLPLSSV
ncbi:DUF87 domain-containing protein [Methanoculleus sp. FWC-SCC1]|uniref:DUF87 domain-containing protein n=1 Tax=Methanoculleus frigidifontis TaxID=2584085 RepID=A0ABT8M9V4_9EURY|nr:DUF87 domain-containing protein [Methanoculleus sp. FWC-SCC1]MDN7024715.1 DUF87 domain-containing protein [Methanoculleus sp. FWC-SCC1]